MGFGVGPFRARGQARGVIGVNRGFVTGVIWGGVVAATGLAVVSQVAPLPQPGPMAETGGVAAPSEEGGAEPVVAPEGIDAADGAGAVAEATDDADQPAEPVPEAGAETGAEVGAADAAAGASAEATAAPDAPEAGAETEGGAEPAAGEATPSPEVAVDALQPEILQKGPPAGAAAPVETAPVETAPDTAQPALSQPEVPMATAPDAPVAPAQPEVGTALPAPVDAAAPGLAQAVAPVEPMPDPAPEAAMDPPAQPGEALMQPAPQGLAEAAPALVAPQEPQPAPQALPQIIAPEEAPDGTAPGMADAADGTEIAMPGLRTDRLPRIGDEMTPPPAEEGAPDAAAGEEMAVLGTTPLELFRRAFENPDGKPIFGLILVDAGLPEEERARLAALPFPVTFALDPLAADAAAAARIYRDAGQEVAMLATGIPQGATAADLEQTFQALDIALPEAVAVLDRMEGGFQDDLALARQAVPIVAEQGRGLVTYDRGLNSADQVARREGAPRATIFRILDGEGESIPKMRNYLDRAAFKAAQEGRVLVIGQARAETVAAILEWTVEGRASSVALAPLSAVLETPPAP